MPRPKCPAEGCTAIITPIRSLGFMPLSCWNCWCRVPIPLRQAWIRTFRAIPGSPFETTRDQARRDLMEWWAANPAPPVTPSVPAWKRHTQGGS